MIVAHVLPGWLWQAQHWFVNAGPNGGYGFWSGVAGATTIFTGAVIVYKQHNCKARWWCPMWGHHKVKGTTAIVCHAHHTHKQHRRLQVRHARKYAHRLTHGESPDPPGKLSV